jgi:exoribonuclease R
MFAKEQIPYVPITRQQLLQRPLEPEIAYAIDGPGARVIDDAISVRSEIAKNGTHIAFINTYIADTALLGVNNSYFDRAKSMGHTVYTGAKTDHMMPSEVIDQLSLGGGGEEGSPAIAIKLKLQANRISILALERVRVNVNKTDYDEFANLYSQGAVKPINEIVDGYNLIRGKSNSECNSINAHDVVATYMRLTNLSLARYAMINCIPWIYRSKKRGYYNHHDVRQAHRAHYTHRPRLHQGLGNNLVYCHGTSPLRRFADHVDQLTLVAYLEGRPAPFDVDDIRDFSIELNKLKLRILGDQAISNVVS